MRTFLHTGASAFTTLLFAYFALGFFGLVTRAAFRAGEAATGRLASPDERMFVLFLPALITGAICGALGTFAALQVFKGASPRGLRWTVAIYFAVISALGLLTMGSIHMPPELAFFSLVRAVAVSFSVWITSAAVERKRKSLPNRHITA